MLNILKKNTGLQALLFISFSIGPVLAATPQAGIRWHVDQNLPSGGNGLGWLTAIDSLETALQQALPGDEVWVARGVYIPVMRQDRTDPRSTAFLLPEGVALRGGFAGHETEAAQRGHQFQRTVLSGDLGSSGVAKDNAYHVVLSEGGLASQGGSARLDGFVIRDGWADQRGHARGAGLRVSGGFLRVIDCTFEANYGLLGGAIFVSGAQLRMNSCVIRNNSSAGRGGGLSIQASRCQVVNTRFYSNLADRGGAIYVHSVGGFLAGLEPPVSFANVVLHDNHARSGGAVFLQGSQYSGAGGASFVHCTISQNHALERGGAIMARTGTPQAATSWISNSIIWANSAPFSPDLAGRHQVHHSNLIQRGWDRGSNLNQDPLFVDSASADFHLRALSPCVDAGSNLLVGEDWADVDRDGFRMEALPLDADGRRRRQDDPRVADTGFGSGAIVDLGAYER